MKYWRFLVVLMCTNNLEFGLELIRDTFAQDFTTTEKIRVEKFNWNV